MPRVEIDLKNSEAKTLSSPELTQEQCEACVAAIEADLGAVEDASGGQHHVGAITLPWDHSTQVLANVLPCRSARRDACGLCTTEDFRIVDGEAA